MMNLIDFVNKINNEHLTSKDHRFFMYAHDVDNELEPVFNSHNELHELVLDDGSNITDEYSLTEILAAKYEIKERGNK